MTETTESLAAVAASLSFVGDRLAVSDPAHVDELDRRYWSASGMVAMQSCPSRWALDRLIRDEAGPFDPAPKGTSAHKVMEVLFSLPPQERTRDRAVSILETLELDFPGEVQAPAETFELPRWRSEVLDLVLPLWDIEDPAAVDVRACEEELDGIEVGGVPLKGFIDRTDVVGDGTRVVDYKTGRSSDERSRQRFGDKHGDQLRLYVRALENRDGVAPERAAIYYTKVGESYEADLSRSAVDSVEHAFVATWDEMKESARTGTYRTKASPLCGWCPMATVCPTARKAGKDAPKVERAKLGTTLGVRSVPAVVHTGAMSATLTGTVLPAALAQVVPAPGGARRKKARMKWPREDKNWVEARGGTLQPNSYAATGVVATTTLAVDTLTSAGVTLKPADILAMAKTLTYVIATVQSRVSDETVYASASARRGDMAPGDSVETFWSDGLNSRIRGVLRSVLDMSPPPFDGDDAAWSAWVTTTCARVEKVLAISQELWEDGPGEKPWGRFTQS